ncbi:MAG: hypothetical protein JNL70_06055 [Saprospiraceae bacterium]|nr:hypothetical protein [Saprospiraceae bacterium]
MRKPPFLLAFALLAFVACVPVKKPEDDIKPEDAVWQMVADINASDSQIRSIYATPFEIYFASDSYLFRLDTAFKLLEKRILTPIDRSPYRRVIMSDNTFTRLYQGASGAYTLEFRHTRNSNVIKRFTTTELVDTARRETFDMETNIRQYGCYNSDGTKFMLPGRLLPANKPYVLLLDVNLTFLQDDIASVKVAKRVELPNLNIDKFESFRYLNGNFYIATYEGGFRITPDGQVRKLFNNWVKDFFAIGDKLYVTGGGDYDFQTSTDNGLTWKRSLPSSLKYIETANNKVFSHALTGLPFGLADSSLTKVQPLKYNTDMTFGNVSDFDIAYFKGRYFTNSKLGKNEVHVFLTKILQTK